MFEQFELLNEIEIPFNIQDLFHLFNTSYSCIFIKNEYSNYQYGNENYLQLMGLTHLKQLKQLNDYDLSKNKKDAIYYRQLDCQTLEEKKPLSVKAKIMPNYNQPIVKVMHGKLYPLMTQQGQYVLGLVYPESRLLRLDWDSMFKLTIQELDQLLPKKRYLIKIKHFELHLSKMEVKTAIQLLKGKKAGEIAEVLSIKQSTVESYLINIKDKLGVNTKSELIDLLTTHNVLQQISL